MSDAVRHHVQVFDRAAGHLKAMLIIKIGTDRSPLVDHVIEQLHVLWMNSGTDAFQRYERPRLKIKNAIELLRPDDFVRGHAPGKAAGPTETLAFGEKCFAASQLFFIDVTLNCDSDNVAGVFNQFQVGRIRAAHFTVINGERAQHRALAREHRPRPACAQTIRQCQMPVLVPEGIAEDVSHIDRLPAIDGRAAATLFRSNRRAIQSGDIGCGKTRRRRAAEMSAVFIEKPDGAQHPSALSFNQSRNDRQHLRQWGPAKNQL